MMSEIRPAVLEDLDVIQRLCFDLGYSPSKEVVFSGLKTILNHPDYELAVIYEDSWVVGWIQLLVRYRVHEEPFLQVIGLVTDSKKRGLGYGKKLLQHAEKRAQEKNLKVVGLYSNKKRIETHEFYKNYGFAESKESSFFTKEI